MEAKEQTKSTVGFTLVSWLATFVFGYLGAKNSNVAELTIAIIVLIFSLALTFGPKKSAQVRPPAAQHALDEARYGELLPISGLNLVHLKSEQFYWAQSATVWHLHTATQYVGGYGGMSMRVARGLWARTGGFRGEPVRQTKYAADDNGTVYLSDRRLVFVGNLGTTVIEYSTIASVQPFTDGLRIDPVHGKPISFETGDERLSIVFGRLVNGEIHTKERPLAALSPSDAVAGASDIIKRVLPPTDA